MMIKKFLKYSLLLILFYSVSCLATPFNKSLRNRSIGNQINYLSRILDKGYDDKLQTRFPEGKIFSNALLALSTIKFCEDSGRRNSNYATVVDNCIRSIMSQDARGIFDEDMYPQYGVFYLGWSNLVYSSYRKSSLFRFSELSDAVSRESAMIDSMLITLQSDSLQIVNSYRGANWPADNLIGISSLQNDSIKNKWIELLLETTEHESGLIHHSGSFPDQVRGSSSAMILYCLAESGYSSVDTYNEIYQDIYVDRFLGVQLVKEHEDGRNSMDLDSGPVLFGYGASATIMNITAQGRLGNRGAKTTWAAMNLISFPVNIFNRKYLLLKAESMLDLFMLWACTEL